MSNGKFEGPFTPKRYHVIRMDGNGNMVEHRSAYPSSRNNLEQLKHEVDIFVNGGFTGDSAFGIVDLIHVVRPIISRQVVTTKPEWPKEPPQVWEGGDQIDFARSDNDDDE